MRLARETDGEKEIEWWKMKLGCETSQRVWFKACLILIMLVKRDGKKKKQCVQLNKVIVEDKLFSILSRIRLRNMDQVEELHLTPFLCDVTILPQLSGISSLSFLSSFQNQGPDDAAAPTDCGHLQSRGRMKEEGKK